MPDKGTEKVLNSVDKVIQKLAEGSARRKSKTKHEMAAGIPWKIYLSRALSSWGDRLWSFGAGVFMNLISPENLRLVAIYGFATSISVIIFGAIIGAWIDKTSRLTSARVFLLIQNLVASICCAILAVFFWPDLYETWSDPVREAVPIVAILLAIVANLASIGSKIAVEKDWIVVISGNDNNKLASMNSVFRTIDLLCLLVAPALAGVVFDFLGNSWAAIFIGIWNIVSVMIEYGLLVSIYKQFPSLGHKNTSENLPFENEGQTEDIIFLAVPKKIWNSMVQSFRAWLCYMKHPARDAGLGLAFLYMTVLGFDNITYGYCLRLCVTESILGVLVGVSAIFGVSGSLSFPHLRKRIGLNRTGLIGFSALIAMLAMCVVSIWLDGSVFDPYFYSRSNSTTPLELDDYEDIFSTTIPPDPDSCVGASYTSVGVFLAGVITARFGLWVSDLTITQILQERVEEDRRGILNGVQSSLNSSMDTLKFILVIVMPEPETYGWLIIVSFAFICFGSMFYSSYVCKNRDKADKGQSI